MFLYCTCRYGFSRVSACLSSRCALTTVVSGVSADRAVRLRLYIVHSPWFDVGSNKARERAKTPTGSIRTMSRVLCLC